MAFLRKKDESYLCSRCDEELVADSESFYYRGRYFWSLNCPKCRAAYNHPEYENMIEFSTRERPNE